LGGLLMDNAVDKTILDFTGATPTIAWSAIDDRIMGGLSESQPVYIKDTGLRFSGLVSLANQGGFASIRSGLRVFDLSPFEGLSIRVCGDGKTYKISLRTDHFYDGVSYQASFQTEPRTWQEIRLPFDTFTPTHHGRKLTTVAPMDRSKVTSFGLFIADQQAGPFQLDIANIRGF
jgi:NADH dehydrogenase [ubiquinone] 1 alpha subcomplex assembly factor 1